MKNAAGFLMALLFSFGTAEVLAQTCSVTCPVNMVASNAEGQCLAVVSFPPPDSSGPCAEITTTPVSGSDFPVGDTIVQVFEGATPDPCTFTVTVVDTEAPLAICPADISELAEAPGAVDFSFQPSDNCPDVSGACSPPSGSEFPLGSSTVECLATDASGLESSCEFTVDLASPAPTGSDLSLSLEVSDSNPESGDDIVYRIEVTNLGPEDNTEVVVSDDIPNKLLFLTFEASAGECTDTGTRIECRVPVLASGETFSLEFTTKILDSGTITNSASASGNLEDPDSSNNDASLGITVGAAGGGGGCDLQSKGASFPAWISLVALVFLFIPAFRKIR